MKLALLVGDAASESRRPRTRSAGMTAGVRSWSRPSGARACCFYGQKKKRVREACGRTPSLNQEKPSTPSAQSSGVFSSISLLHFPVLCPRLVLHAEGAETIAMAAVAPRADAAFGTLRFPTSPLIFRASLTLFTSQKTPPYLHSRADGFSLRREGSGFDSPVVVFFSKSSQNSPQRFVSTEDKCS